MAGLENYKDLKPEWTVDDLNILELAFTFD